MPLQEKNCTTIIINSENTLDLRIMGRYDAETGWYYFDSDDYGDIVSSCCNAKYVVNKDGQTTCNSCKQLCNLRQLLK